ncbi:hypothetical protein [Streptomyces sp. NPDC058728]
MRLGARRLRRRAPLNLDGRLVDVEPGRVVREAEAAAARIGAAV